jgi:hypothetical protein
MDVALADEIQLGMDLVDGFVLCLGNVCCKCGEVFSPGVLQGDFTALPDSVKDVCT